MGFPYYDQVQRAYQELLNEGKIARRTHPEQVEQDKGLLTRRAGYYVNTEEDERIGLLEKTEGNNSLGYSVDLLLRIPEGTFWDIATDDNGMACPVDGGPSGPDPALVPRWAKPTAELAQVSGEEGSGEVSDGVYDENKSVQFGNACNQTYQECGAAPDGGMISVHSQRCAFDYYVGMMPWDACYEKHVNEFRAEYGLAPISGGDA